MNSQQNPKKAPSGSQQNKQRTLPCASHETSHSGSKDMTRNTRFNLITATLFAIPFIMPIANHIINPKPSTEKVAATLIEWKQVHEHVHLMDILFMPDIRPHSHIRSKIRFTLGQKSYTVITNTPDCDREEMMINATGVAYLHNGEPSMVKMFRPRH